MYGNEGEKWVMTKPLSLNGLTLNGVGTEFEITPYYSVPHGYASIQYEGILLFIPDKFFEEHFIKWEGIGWHTQKRLPYQLQGQKPI